MEIVSYNEYSALDDKLEDAWDRLGEQGLYFVPDFSELKHRLQTEGVKFRLLVATDNRQIIAIACFIYGNAIKSYEIATRKLLHLPVREVTLFGSCVVGEPDESIIRRFFHLVITGPNFDLIDVGNIFVDSPLYNAVTSLKDGVVAWSGTRKKRLWWFIRLPASFDEYVASLRERTRAHVIRDYRKFEKEAPGFRVTSLPDEVEDFLQAAETISRSTYQWRLGYGTCNDEITQQHLTRLARNGVLRCYILYFQGSPCAFGWGELSHHKFRFRKTGYDPRYRKFSPGTTLIMRMIRDLIENTNCGLFDFMWGDADGYKSRFGNVSFSCDSIQVARVYRPYSLLVILLDLGLIAIKNLAGLIIERGPFRRRLRSALRRRGVGTY